MFVLAPVVLSIVFSLLCVAMVQGKKETKKPVVDKKATKQPVVDGASASGTLSQALGVPAASLADSPDQPMLAVVAGALAPSSAEGGAPAAGLSIAAASLPGSPSPPTPLGAAASPGAAGMVSQLLPAPSAPVVASPKAYLRKRRRSDAASPRKPGFTSIQPLQVVVYKYAVDGSAVTAEFEANLPCFTLLLKQDGNQRFPSVLYQMKAYLQNFLQANLSHDPNGPQQLSDLVPC